MYTEAEHSAFSIELYICRVICAVLSNTASININNDSGCFVDLKCIYKVSTNSEFDC